VLNGRKQGRRERTDSRCLFRGHVLNVEVAARPRLPCRPAASPSTLQQRCPMSRAIHRCVLLDETVRCLTLCCDCSKCAAVFETCSICGANASKFSRCPDGVGHDDPLARFATYTTTTPLRPERIFACIYDLHCDHIRPLCINFCGLTRLASHSCSSHNPHGSACRRDIIQSIPAATPRPTHVAILPERCRVARTCCNL
jgi:hypothetical protein